VEASTAIAGLSQYVAFRNHFNILKILPCRASLHLVAISERVLGGYVRGQNFEVPTDTEFDSVFEQI